MQTSHRPLSGLSSAISSLVLAACCKNRLVWRGCGGWEQSATVVTEQSITSMAAVVIPFQVIKYCPYAAVSLCLLSLITSFQLLHYDSIPIARGVQFLEKESCWCNKQTMNCGHEEKQSHYMEIYANLPSCTGNFLSALL